MSSKAIAAKDQELAHLQELQRASSSLVSLLEGTATRFQQLEADSRVVSNVLNNWSTVFATAADARRSEHSQLVLVPTERADGPAEGMPAAE